MAVAVKRVERFAREMRTVVVKGGREKLGQYVCAEAARLDTVGEI